MSGFTEKEHIKNPSYPEWQHENKDVQEKKESLKKEPLKSSNPSEPEVVSKYEYHCYACNSNSFTDNEVEQCPKCESEFVCQKGMKDFNKAGGKFNLKNLFKAFSDKSLHAIESMYMALGEVGYGISDTFNSTKESSNSEFKKTLGELGSLKNLVIYKKQQEENGQKSTKEVSLGDLFIPFVRKFNLMNKDNANSPASDSSLKNLEEIDINNDDEEESKGESLKEAPVCTICSNKCKDKAIKPECGHYFHKDCLVPWLKIHNRCPSCSQIVAK